MKKTMSRIIKTMRSTRPKQITRMAAAVFLTLFAISCNYYDARWFTQRKSTLSSDAVTPPDTPVDLPAADQDPFKQDSTPKPDDGGFSATQFNDWRLKAVFDKSNVPTYTFQGNGWVNIDISSRASLKNPGIMVSKADVYNGANTAAGSNNISNVKYYRFPKQHPMFGDEFSYNQNPHATRLQRFNFYWFEGDTAAPHLSNALIAVDTYSKLVFAYAKPIQSEKLIASEPPVPTRWGPFESYSKGPGDKAYNFYEYDPIGYVKSDGNVVLYAWYITAQAASQYDPRMQFIGGTVASASGPGRSPYAPVKVDANDNQDGVSGVLTVSAVRLSNVSSKSYVYSSNGGSLGLFGIGAVGNVQAPNSYTYSKTVNMGCYVYALQSRAYDGATTPNFDTLEHVNEGSSLRSRGTKTKIDPPQAGYREGYIPGPCVTCEKFGKKPNTNGLADVYPKCIDTGASAQFSSQKTYAFDGVKSNIKLELSNSLIRYNYEDKKDFWHLIDNAEGWRLWPQVAEKDAIVDEFKFATGMIVPFKYSRANKAWEVGENTTTGVQGVLVSYDKDFTLKNGESKQFTVTLIRKHPGFSDETNKIIYNLSWANENVQNNQQAPVDGTLKVTLKEMKNVSAQTHMYDTKRSLENFKWKYYYAYANTQNKACYVYSVLTRGPASFATLTEHNSGASFAARNASGPDVLTKAKCVNANSTLPVNLSKQYSYSQETKEMYVSLKHNLLRYNIESGNNSSYDNKYGYRLWADKAKAGNFVDEFVFAKDLSFSLLYNRGQEAWVFANATPYSDSLGSTTLTYDKDFLLKRGDTKELRLGFSKTHSGGRGLEKSEFVYELSWQ